MKTVSAFIILLWIISVDVSAQKSIVSADYFLLENRYYQSAGAIADTVDERSDEEFPTPRSVLFKSMIVPGWGQVVNGQVWKVPIVYGLFAGVGVYAFYLHDQYKDYRTAYYNSVQTEDNDFRFGATPEYLEGVGTNELLENRTSLRNRRDFMYVVLGLAYGLNIIDAYVYAHMRSFDVSDDLSARATLQPALLAEGSPGVKLSFSFSSK